MFYFVHLDEYDEKENKIKSVKVLVHTEGYKKGYKELMDALDAHFGVETIEKITLIEPITDNSVLYVDEVSESHIREQDLNGF
jgi:hypothetical protein